MTTTLIQSTFQFGEVSPLLFARIDSPIYQRAARVLENVVTIPQGGVEVRFGTKFIGSVLGSVTDYTKIKLFIMRNEDGSKYLFVFRPTFIDVYYNDIYQTTITTTYLENEVKDISLAQSPNLLFIAHGNHQPQILRRVTHTSWVLEVTPKFTHFPTYDFLQNYDDAIFQVLVGGVPITTANNVLGLDVQLSSTKPIFLPEHVGGLFFGDSGTLRITGTVSATLVNARIVNVFDPDSGLFHGGNNILGADSVLTEKAFSTSRGWPQKVGFFQNRIFFARSKNLMGGLWGSNYNGFSYNSFNFDDSENLDTNAVSTVIYNRRSVLIEHLVAYKSLLIFTTSGLFSTPLLEDFPITPNNIAFINLQTADSSSVVQPQILDNQVIFFDKGGRKVKDVNLLARTGTYSTNNISVLASHLIDGPYSAGVYENSTEKDGTWLMVTMNQGERDGELVIYQTVPEQEITAWTHSVTDGKFRHVTADEDLVYFAIEREVNGVKKLYIEKLDFTYRTDCAKIQLYETPTSTITGLDHLEGKTVRVIGDNALMKSKTVTGGQIELEYAVSKAQVGLNFNPTIVPMPLNMPTQFGNNIYLPKTVKKMYIDFNESLGIVLNGQFIPPFKMGTDEYDTKAIPKTDFYGISLFNGWNPRQTFTITQNDPLPFKVIGIGFEVEQ
jgi:hypothetical protein